MVVVMVRNGTMDMAERAISLVVRFAILVKVGVKIKIGIVDNIMVRAKNKIVMFFLEG